MDRKEIKQEAKDVLKGNWLKFALMLTIYGSISIVISVIPVIGSLLSIVFIVFSIPLQYGITISFVKRYKKEKIGFFDFIKDGFANFRNAWSIIFRKLGKVWYYLVGSIICRVIYSFYLIICSISTLGLMKISVETVIKNAPFLVIVAFIINIVLSILMTMKLYYYTLAEYLMIDSKVKTPKEAIEKSKEFMEGKRGEWFVLGISFVLWFLLVGVILGIVFGIITFIEMLQFSNTIIETISILLLVARILMIIDIFVMIFDIIYVRMSFVVAYKKLIGKDNIEMKIEQKDKINVEVIQDTPNEDLNPFQE